MMTTCHKNLFMSLKGVTDELNMIKIHYMHPWNSQKINLKIIYFLNDRNN